MAFIVSAVGASSASAVLKRIGKHQIVSYQPLPGKATKSLLRKYDLVFGNMDYNGGPIMPTNTDYMVVWSPKGTGVFPSEYIPGLARFWQDLAHDNGMNTNTDSVTAGQYNDLTGASVHYAVTFGGVLLDTDPFPPSACPVNGTVTNCLSDAQLQHELQKFTTANHLPQDLTHEYYLFTPPHVASCFTDQPPTFGFCSVVINPFELAGFCAYHENTTTNPMLFYAVEPYLVHSVCDDGNHPNGVSDAELVGGMDHEHNESITDPIPNDAWTNGAGANQGLEVGDQCDGQMGPFAIVPGTKDTKYNQVINGHFYWFQEEWSNQGHTCLQRRTPTEPQPTATETVTAAGGTTMNFDATGSTAPGGVAEFSWQFNDAFAAQTQEQTTPMISHTFPEAGAYSTGVAVFAADGLASGTGGIIVTGHNGFIPGFDFSPASPTTGQTVTFHGLKIISRNPVTSTMWEFGDGTTGSGRNPTHTYAAPGTYTVTVVQFSGVGSAFPGQGAGPVSTRTITVS